MLLEQRLEPVALGVGQLAGDAGGGAVGHVDQEPAGQADLAGQPGALVPDRVLGHLHQHRLAGREHRLDLAGLAVLVARARDPVDLAGVQDGVAAAADVDERRLHGRQHVLDPAEVDVADQRGLRLAGDVVLDQDLVLEHADLGEVVALADDHDPLDGLAAGQELGLADDRCAAATGLAALTAALLLGLEPGRARDGGDLVLGGAGPADPGDGVLGVVGAARTVLARPATAPPAARGAVTGLVVGVGRISVLRVLAGLALATLARGLAAATAATAAATTAGPGSVTISGVRVGVSRPFRFVLRFVLRLVLGGSLLGRLPRGGLLGGLLGRLRPVTGVGLRGGGLRGVVGGGLLGGLPGGLLGRLLDGVGHLEEHGGCRRRGGLLGLPGRRGGRLGGLLRSGLLRGHLLGGRLLRGGLLGRDLLGRRLLRRGLLGGRLAGRRGRLGGDFRNLGGLVLGHVLLLNPGA